MRYRPLGHDPEDDRLGRLVPDDWKHVEKYPLTAVLPAAVPTVERVLNLPKWHWTHDQGAEGSCVGHGSVMERAITNIAQNVRNAVYPHTRRYDPIDLWNAAKEIDEWPDTNPGDANGTSVRAAYDVLRQRGPRPIRTTGIRISSDSGLPEVIDTSRATDPAEGVAATRWSTSVDELRTGLSEGVPVTIGVNWYSRFDEVVQRRTGRGRNPEAWTGVGTLGRLRGGHCVCLFGASDERQAFRLKNSWGRAYPPVWLSYGVISRLLTEDGEAALATDR